MAGQRDGETVYRDVTHMRGCDDAAMRMRDLEGPHRWTFVVYRGALHDKNLGGARVGDSMFCWELENTVGNFLFKEVIKGVCAL